MNENATAGLQNSGTNMQLRQVLSHLQIASPAEGDPTCQACGETIREGDSVTLSLFRPAGRSGYTVDQCRCNDHIGDLTSLFTLGTRELVVDGRIRQCHDRASQQTWPVLFAPALRVVSAADTKTGGVVTTQRDRARINADHDTPTQHRLDTATTGGTHPVPTPTGGHR